MSLTPDEIPSEVDADGDVDAVNKSPVMCSYVSDWFPDVAPKILQVGWIRCHCIPLVHAQRRRSLRACPALLD